MYRKSVGLRLPSGGAGCSVMNELSLRGVGHVDVGNNLEQLLQGGRVLELNKTGLQPVSRPVERIFGFFPKGFNAKNGAKKCSKNV